MKICVLCDESFDDEENCGCGEKMTVNEYMCKVRANPLDRIATALEKIARILDKIERKGTFK